MNFRNLNVWQLSIKLVEQIYLLTVKFPHEEKYGLTSQIRRSSISIPSNIAEGSSRKSQKEFAHFISIAIGSSFELETQLIIANKIRLIEQKDFTEIAQMLNHIQAILHSFKNKIIATNH
ncbi:MAG: four helix bundle protein [Bacteroidetes bacterium]|nr:four helix bundle protein [Bacteroidota bacterium]